MEGLVLLDGKLSARQRDSERQDPRSNERPRTHAQGAGRLSGLHDATLRVIAKGVDRESAKNEYLAPKPILDGKRHGFEDKAPTPMTCCPGTPIPASLSAALDSGCNGQPLSSEAE